MDKHPLQSNTLRGIIIALLLWFARSMGYIGSNEQVTITIDNQTENHQEDKIIDFGILAGLGLAAKGRYDAGGIKKLGGKK